MIKTLVTKFPETEIEQDIADGYIIYSGSGTFDGVGKYNVSTDGYIKNNPKSVLKFQADQNNLGATSITIDGANSGNLVTNENLELLPDNIIAGMWVVCMWNSSYSNYQIINLLLGEGTPEPAPIVGEPKLTISFIPFTLYYYGRLFPSGSVYWKEKSSDNTNYNAIQSYYSNLSSDEYFNKVNLINSLYISASISNPLKFDGGSQNCGYFSLNIETDAANRINSFAYFLKAQLTISALDIEWFKNFEIEKLIISRPNLAEVQLLSYNDGAFLSDLQIKLQSNLMTYWCTNGLSEESIFIKFASSSGVEWSYEIKLPRCYNFEEIELEKYRTPTLTYEFLTQTSVTIKSSDLVTIVYSDGVETTDSYRDNLTPNTEYEVFAYVPAKPSQYLQSDNSEILTFTTLQKESRLAPSVPILVGTPTTHSLTISSDETSFIKWWIHPSDTELMNWSDTLPQNIPAVTQLEGFSVSPVAINNISASCRIIAKSVYLEDNTRLESPYSSEVTFTTADIPLLIQDNPPAPTVISKAVDFGVMGGKFIVVTGAILLVGIVPSKYWQYLSTVPSYSIMTRKNNGEFCGIYTVDYPSKIQAPILYGSYYPDKLGYTNPDTLTFYKMEDDTPVVVSRIDIMSNGVLL